MRKGPEHKEEEGFLSRWSRKKSESHAPEQQFDDPVSLEAPPVAEQEQPVTGRMQVEGEQSLRTQTDEPKPVLTDEDMPDIGSLTEDSDYSGFMSEGVSEELRKLALRKLFAGAGFNIRDGLDDYDDDFRSFAALGDIITSDMKHQMEMAEKRKKEEEEEKKRLAEEEAKTQELAESDESEEPEQDDVVQDEDIQVTGVADEDATQKV